MASTPPSLPPSLPPSEQRRICKSCYLVIENYLKGDSRKNENYLARFMDFFRKQVQLTLVIIIQHIYCPSSSLKVRMGLNAEEVMVEMCEDNM